MKIQYASDLYLGLKSNFLYMYYNPLIKSADVLVLAGDVGVHTSNQLDEHFIDHISKDFDMVYILAGDEELHRSSNQIDESFNTQLRNNVQYLSNQTVYPTSDIRMIFTPLWTKISQACYNEMQNSQGNLLSLFRYDLKSVESYLVYHQTSLEFLTSELDKPFKGKTIVISHHVPYIPPDIEGYKEEIKEAYHVDLSEIFQKHEIAHWIHGHNHFNVAPFNLLGTEVHTNQLGYVEHGGHFSFKTSATLVV